MDFLIGDCFEWVSESFIPSVFDLDKKINPILLTDNIDLTSSDRIVSFDDIISPILEILDSYVLSYVSYLSCRHDKC